MKSGKKMICNAALVRVTHPPEVLISEYGETIKYKHGDGLDVNTKYYRPHWPVCPKAKEFRKK